jgi:antibiotic biosynthesis monooxygenase (ABM) superfamily enzyme
MISRIWHGYTTSQNAAAYEDLLLSEIFHTIEAKKIDGYRGIQLLKRELDDEWEFITIMWFENIDSVKQFMGDDYEASYVLPQAQKLLSHYDRRSAHYHLVQEFKYDG